jgi:LacI family transcriptional regulator, galactose operon repressor
MTNISITRTAVWEPFVERIRADISAGRVKPGTRIGTEYDFMRQTGLSRTSVRRGIKHLIDEGLLERRVGKGVYVRELHHSTHVIQFVVPDMAIDLYVRMTRAIQDWGRKHGVDIQLHNAHGSFDHDIKYVQSLPDKSMSGAIISSLYHPKFINALFELKRQGYPFVLVGHHLDELEVPSVAADNYGGGYLVGQELFKYGHGRRIAFIGALRYQATARRLEGLKDAMSDQGLAYDRALFKDLDVALPCDDWSDLVQEKVSELLGLAEPPTVLVFGSTSLAASAYPVLKSRGLSIPGDISVATFDDEPYVQFLDPPMSLIRQPGEDIGTAAIQMLMDRLKGVGASEQVTLPVKWVPRASVGKPPAPRRHG